jgi:DNA-binding HxlR family transcriptional regulator
MARELAAKADADPIRCPVASTLELLGDRWTLVVVRDLFLGKRRYGEFQDSPEGIPTNILAERLKRLEYLGIIDKTAYQEHPVRHDYTLTTKGTELLPVVRALREWGLKHVPGTGIPERYRALVEASQTNSPEGGRGRVASAPPSTRPGKKKAP